MLTTAIPLVFLPLLSGVIAQSTSPETIRAAVIFSRHGDRTWKGAPPTQLTVLGQNQLYNSGSYYRSRYLNSSSSLQIAGISTDYQSSQVYASSPDQTLLVTSGQAFLQGLYPPEQEVATLVNGTSQIAPLGGYQYATLHTISTDDPATIWLKGDDGCSAYDSAGDNFYRSAQYYALKESTKSFYDAFNDIFAGVLADSALGYHNAYTIYDYVNVGSIHNSTIADRVSSSELFQLRTLADSQEVALNANMSSSEVVGLTISARTLANKVLTQLASVISSSGSSNKFSLLMGSYDTFLSFFGITGLQQVSENFYGLPDYGSTLVFELFSYGNDTAFPTEDELYVRFLFRNGTTEEDVTAYPLFGNTDVVMTWAEFGAAVSAVSVTSVSEWCSACGTTDGICTASADNAITSSSATGSHDRISPQVAGVVGALVALAVAALGLGIAMLYGVRFTRGNKADRGNLSAEKLDGASDISKSV